MDKRARTGMFSHTRNAMASHPTSPKQQSPPTRFTDHAHLFIVAAGREEGGGNKTEKRPNPGVKPLLVGA